MILDQQHTVIIEQIEELQHTLEIIETERLKYSNIINKIILQLFAVNK